MIILNAIVLGLIPYSLVDFCVLFAKRSAVVLETDLNMEIALFCVTMLTTSYCLVLVF